jgi:hypothetical protein
MRGCVGVILLVVAAAAAGCTESKTTIAPDSTLNVAGTWSASVDVSGTTAKMTWTLAQNGTSVSGTVTTALPSGIVLMNGSFVGMLTGSSLAGTIGVAPGGIPAYPACTGQLTSTMNVTLGAVSTMNGQMSVVSSACTVPITTSTITLTRS